MKIVYLSNSFLPSRSANSIHVMHMCAALARAGHDVQLIGWRGDESQADVFAYYGVEPGFGLVTFRRVRVPGSVLVLAAQVRRWATGRTPPDLYYSRNPYCLAAVAQTGAPLVYEAHLPPLKSHAARAERWLFGRPNFASLVVISDALRREYCRLFPQLEKSRVLIAPDAASMPPADAGSGAITLPGRPGTLRVGYAGHLYPGKGIEVVVPLAARLPQVDFHVVGGLEKDIRRLQAEHSLENLYFHGFLPPHEIPRLLQGFDIVLAPYQERVHTARAASEIGRWMSPLKIFEYMAARRPIVASDLPVLREVLVHGRNSLLCSPTDVEQWAGAVETLAGDPRLADRLVANAHADFLANYTWDARVERVLGGLKPAMTL